MWPQGSRVRGRFYCSNKEGDEGNGRRDERRTMLLSALEDPAEDVGDPSIIALAQNVLSKPPFRELQRHTVEGPMRERAGKGRRNRRERALP